MNKTTRTLVVCLIAFLAGVKAARAQKFEAADIHPSVRTRAIRMPYINSEMRAGFTGGGRYELQMATMTDLIGFAWGVDTYRVIGGPDWMDRDHFDVIAKVPADTKTASLRLMLQALLAERFKLVVHKDTRAFPQYALMAGKHPLLNPAAGIGESGCQSPPQNAQDIAAGAGLSATVSCHNMTMAEFANRLPRMARNYFQASPVVDLTGIEGSWDFTLKWTERNLLAATGAEGTTIFSAVEKQLGLKLEVQQVPVPVVVVDSVNEKPTDNLPGVAEELPAIPTRFEVADIKPSAPGSTQRSFRGEPGGRIDVRGFTLKDLIKIAWGIEDLDVIDQVAGSDSDDRLVGAPKWLDAARFDIVARAQSGTSAGLQTELLLRALLADRFKLTTHYEDQPITVYAMVAAKPKLKKADPSNRPSCRNAPAPSGSMPIFSLTCRNTTMAELADELPAFGAAYVTHPVVDETGLEGGWDFVLNWSPPHLIRSGSGEAGQPADPNGAFTIVEALEKQLGLKLVLQKHPMPVLVIDHVEREPTDN